MRTNRREFLKGVTAAGLSAAAIGAVDASADTETKEKAKTMDLTYVTYCGLYCKLCGDIARIPPRAAALLKSLRDEGYEYWGDKDLLKKLQNLSDKEKGFTGCRGGKCGIPDCAIRKCAAERKVVVCSSCKEYPCKRLDWLAARYPTLLADGRRQQEVGLETWIAEQEERAKTGFCYADIRCDTDRAKLKLACCGLDCGACDVKREDCAGCQSNSGKQWTGDCKVRACCKGERKLDNCSVCKDFACANVTAFENDKWPHHGKAIGKLREMQG